jgi:hypothetical protein
MSSAFRVGDRVQVPLGRRRITGVITEDREAIGVRGRHLYEVLVSMDPFEPTTFELPEDEIEAMDDLAEPGAAMRKDEIEAYLIHGGLIGILRSNLSGGRSQPRVWLRPDTIGNVTHTFERERGGLSAEKWFRSRQSMTTRFSHRSVTKSCLSCGASTSIPRTQRELSPRSEPLRETSLA